MLSLVPGARSSATEMSYPGAMIPQVTHNAEPEPAAQPEDLGRFFLERANAGDVEGLVALYEPDAVLAFPPGQLTAGHEQIRKVYAELLADKPSFSSAGQQPVIRNGDLALTSTRLPGGGATVEIARRQPDGTWRWVIDQPAVVLPADQGNGSRSGSTQP
jgi:ketosteroid isomerase-like protein